jgi:cation diffusion facilitator CzcD-associated flavoprotein CzcO
VEGTATVVVVEIDGAATVVGGTTSAVQAATARAAKANNLTLLIHSLTAVTPRAFQQLPNPKMHPKQQQQTTPTLSAAQ